MTVRDEIIQKIKKKVFVAVPVTDKSNLYTDLNFDSLSFVVLLTEIEAAYSITFDIAEIETCLQVNQLITTVERKIKERDHDND